MNARTADLDPALPVDTALNRTLVFSIGALLAITTLTRDYVGTPVDLASRIVPVDLLCAALMTILIARHRLKRFPVPAILYVTALFLSIIPGVAVTQGPSTIVWVGLAAVLMAFAFYAVGLNIGASPALIRCLLAGVGVGVLVEGLVVAHDLLSSHQWFPDPMEGRVRGTFKANGQLGAYGFCAGGLLLTFGTLVESKFLRRLCFAAGVLAVSFVFPASRRTGMVAVFLWAGLILLLGWRFSTRRGYQAFVGCLVAFVVTVALFWPEIQASFLGRRLLGAFDGIGHGEGFIANQFRDVLTSADGWFPFGFGVGKGYWINPRDLHEVHNCYFAVAVEFGILGLAGFLGLVAVPLMSVRRAPVVPGSDLFRLMFVSFMLSIGVFMVHNTLFRDRTFLLFIGVSTAWMMSRPRQKRTQVFAATILPRALEKLPAPELQEAASVPRTTP